MGDKAIFAVKDLNFEKKGLKSFGKSFGLCLCSESILCKVIVLGWTVAFLCVVLKRIQIFLKGSVLSTYFLVENNVNERFY